MSNNLVDLQKIILGKRKEPLSAMEIKELFSHPTTPEFILTLVKALNLKKIDPETALIQAIANADTKESLIPVALSLRYGADSNLYVETAGVGNIHILGFTYYKLSQPARIGCVQPTNTCLVNTIVMLLIASGSNALLPVFDESGGCVRSEFALTDNIPGKNVINWLCEACYDTILDQIDETLCNVKPETVTLIATFLDCPEMLKTDPKLEEVIASHANQILDKFAHLGNPESGLSMSIKYLNLNAFEKFIDLGASVEYWQVNNILLRMRIYKELKDLISLSNMFNMLLYAVEHGTVVDLYQLKLLERIDSQLVVTLKEKYSEPYIRKICKVCKGDVSAELQLLAYHVNLNPEWPKKTICEEMGKIAMADPEEFKKAALKRQEKRISDTLSPIRQFIKDNSPQILLRNRSVVENIYDYVDADIVFYTDAEGVNWGFIRNQFGDLLDEDKNPYTEQKLPINLKDEMERKREYHILLGLPAKPVRVSQTVDNLMKKDEINDNRTEKTLKRFYNMASLEGINRNFVQGLSKESLQNSLDNINVVTDLTDLDAEFAEVTFAVSAETMLRKNRYMVSDFFSDLRMNSRALLGNL